MSGNLKTKRAFRNITELRSGYWRTYTSFAADVDFFNDGPQSTGGVGSNIPCAELCFVCTTAGNLVLVRPDGSLITHSIILGRNVLPVSAIGFRTSGTTAVGSLEVYW